MVFTDKDLKERLEHLRQQFQKSATAVEQEFEEHLNWLQSVCEGVKNGSINVRSVLVPKTPAKRKGPLNAIRESLESTIELDDVRPTRNNTQKKRASKKTQNKNTAGRQKKTPFIEEEDEEELETPASAKRLKRQSEDAIDPASKRLCGSRSSETTSRDSGLSSVGSRNTRGSTMSGYVVKQELLSPKNRSMESTVHDEKEGDSSYETAAGRSSISRLSSTLVTSNLQTTELPSPGPPNKRTRSAGRGTFVVKEEVRRSSRSQSVPRVSDAHLSSTLKNNTLVVATDVTSPLTSPVLSASSKSLISAVKSPMVVKAPSIHLLKGETVKKTVKAFEALNEDHEGRGSDTCMASPGGFKMPQPSKLQPPSASAASSLDDAINAPTRLTRTKTRAMAKAAAEEDNLKKQDNQTQSSFSKILKSPIQFQKYTPAPKTVEKRFEDNYEKENPSLSSSKYLKKPFGSAMKTPLILKSSAVPNRTTPSNLSYSASTSFTSTRINNLITSVESFISKPPVHHEVKPSREENLQKLAAKAEVASKKKEEMMKAQLEEKIKKRQEKRLKVCAAREAMEKEKLLMQQKLEREREEKQKQLQVEREKLRQEFLKKKGQTLLKAAETEERRRQEEAIRLAKLKQQEEEQRRIAAQRKKEQEEAERKHLERLQQEREAAALRIKEAERLAKESAFKAKNMAKPQLDQTYDKLSPANQPYGLTPVPEDRQPVPLPNPNNYGIDDAGTDDSSEDESKPKKMVPLWAQPKQRLPKLLDDYEVTRPQMFSFFESKKSTPDLSKIFTSIDRRYLIRKSSAVWRTPPVKC